MPRTAPVGGSGDFQLVEEGTHLARWTQLIDLGTQEGEFGAKRVVLAGFEILDDEPLKDGDRPAMVWKRYNWSMNEKATLRAAVQSVTGKKLNDDEAASFDVCKLAEKATPCMVQVVHNERNGRTYANIANLTTVPKGMKPGPARGEIVVFDLDAPDAAVFGSLSDKLQTQIQSSPEWQQHPFKKPAEDNIPDSF